MARVNRARLGFGLCCLAVATTTAEAGADASAAGSAAGSVVIFADLDDSDDNGIADARGTTFGTAVTEALHAIDNPKGQRVRVSQGGVRLIAGEKLAPRGSGAKRVFLQGTTPGPAAVSVGAQTLRVQVLGFALLDRVGRRVDPALSHASISRSLPASLRGKSALPDDDSLRWLVVGPAGALPKSVHVVSVDAASAPLDRLGDVPLADVQCPKTVSGSDKACRATPFLRATSDDIDRSHPDSAAVSLRAEVGGKIVISVEERAITSLRVGGPRVTAVGPLGRYRAKLRVHLVRQAKGGAPPIGGTEAVAKRLARADLRAASGVWGQCGVSFGPAKEQFIQVVDPPEPFLVAVGCDRGLPASGGNIRLQVDGKTVQVATPPGASPRRVTHLLKRALIAAGLAPIVSPNPRIAPGAMPTFDLLVRRRDGSRAAVSASGPVSSDPTMNVCIGEVELSDGLTHFSDFDAAAGTVEERALIKALADADPSSIEVIVIPSFARTGRIGESFIFADGGSVRNVVIIDRAAIVAGARSYTLAHELGHILLDVPGHPDDYGVDRPSDLMDADAADPTIFGPRRLSVAECERAQRQSGAGAPMPLLRPWPLIRR